MRIFDDYHFVRKGKKREEIVKALMIPKTPTQLKDDLKLHATTITRTLNELKKRELVESHKLNRKQKTFRLTKKGEFIRLLINHIYRHPTTKTELSKQLKINHKLISQMLKYLEDKGVITAIKTRKPARKIYQLTKKGEMIRGELATSQES